MKISTGALSGESGRVQCGQVLRGSILGERCGEVVSHVCDECAVGICWLHTHSEERSELCPACAEKRRAHAMDTLRAVLGTRKLTDSAKWRALHAALARLTAQAPERDRRLRRVVEFVRRLWARLWGG
jgi:hypothetical protein